MSNKNKFREPVTHHVKTNIEFFEDVKSGIKNFEIRRDDRGCCNGDILVQHEWDPKKKQFTGQSVRRTITYILRDRKYGLKRGYYIMSLK